MKALYRFLSSSACIIAIIVFAVLAAVMCACTITYDGDVNFTGSTWMNPISMYSIIGLLLAVIIIPLVPKAWHFACNANMHATAIICMTIIAIIGCIWSLFFTTAPATDDIMTLNDIASTIKRTGAFNHNSVQTIMIPDALDYLHHLPYQSGFILYLLGIMALIGSTMSELPFQLINAVIWLPLAALMLAFLSRELSLSIHASEDVPDKRIQVGAFNMTMILLACYTPFSCYAFKAYGNIVVLPFMFAALTLTMRTCRHAGTINSKQHVMNLILLALCSFMMTWLKPNSMIIIIAIIITIIVSALKTCERNGIIMRAFTAIIVCMMTWLGSIIPVMIMQRFTDVNLYDSKQPPMSWIAMGTVYNEGSGTPGFFNETYLGDTWKNWQDTETTNRHMYDAAKQNISKLTDNQLWVSFIASKITYTYADPSFVAFSRPVAEYMVWNGMPEQYDYIRQLQDRRIHDGTAVAKPYQQFVLNNIQWVSVPFDALQALPSMLAFIGICTIWNNRRRMKTAGINMQTLLPALCVIGGFLFHLLWETQPEYGFTYFLLLIPYAVCAMPACQHSLVHVMHV